MGLFLKQDLEIAGNGSGRFETISKTGSGKTRQWLEKAWGDSQSRSEVLQQIAAVCVFFEAARPTMKNLGRCQGTHPLGAAQVREPEPASFASLANPLLGLGGLAGPGGGMRRVLQGGPAGNDRRPANPGYDPSLWAPAKDLRSLKKSANLEMVSNSFSKFYK